MDTPPAEELLKKIQELEAGQAQLKQEMSSLRLSDPRPHHHTRQRSHSISPQRTRLAAAAITRRRSGGIETRTAWRQGSASFSHSSPLQRESRSLDPPNEEGGDDGPSATKFTDKQYLNILECMGQSVHIFDLSGRIIYWNRTAENLYGYSAAEALGKDAIELVVDPQDFGVVNMIVNRVMMGERWTGQIPVKNKMGERFSAVATNTPFYDDYDTLAFKVSNKVKSKIRTADNNTDRESEAGDAPHLDHGFSDDHRDDAASSGASTPRGDVPPSSFGAYSQSDERSPGKPQRDSGDESDKLALHKLLTSKAEAWIGKQGLTWPWKGNDREAEARAEQSDLPFLHNSQENESIQLRNSSGAKSESHAGEGNRSGNNEATGSWSSVNVNSTSSASSCGSTSSSAINKVDMETDCLDYEILWEDLAIGEQIGQGSCGTVYHALWYGSDVAVKVFSKQEYSEDVIHSFRQEVSLMKRLRHPNVLLFMGAVTSPQRLCIVTEFLP
ncbi:hypothetical protein CRG98_031516, partial [Punica granatum]